MISLLIDVAKGMDYLHNSDIGSHGHLRSSKCVVDSRWHCKITGYGLSELRRRHNVQSPKVKGNSMLYIAPELLRTSIHYRNYYGTRKGDIYSFGIILQEVIIMDRPYALEVKKKVKLATILANVRSKILEVPYRPSLGEKCPREWRMLAHICWNEEPERRFSFQQILTILRKLAGTDNLTFVERLSQRLEQNVSNLGIMVTDLTAHLEVESEKASNLLGCLLPKAVADDYILGKAYQPKIFKSVTILCTDIMGFTKISAKSTARQTVDFLNALYSSYDAIVKTRDAYKLETIGDAYIVISGCPEKNGDQHASEIAGVALDLFEVLKTHTIPHLPDETIKSRGGIHSGPIIAGVVGLKVPRFCVFGKTYDIAELMESSSKANMIRISSTSVNLLPNAKFKLSSMENILMPDKKSSIETYFLLGKT
ncbi:hypothetical protein HELRODRAFT_108365 [Helobdella robusta]|uniref:guanylate cyclase n=1 Tax=Helobdella robusta TaxID=6412 RepID=T1EEI5_HELRO|nr:hypothetical protein HELRODRAFT_108365 [Helobdella robusta]ESN91552.1 hypothetical protein HELRODRAFT_108365 [Helobdella robusta]